MTVDDVIDLVQVSVDRLRREHTGARRGLQDRDDDPARRRHKAASLGAMVSD
jgi:hypothetical protein